MSTEQRKAEHIRICLEESVAGKGITTGLEQYRFVHKALPELDFQEIDLTTEFMGKRIGAPFIISSMTGGTEQARQINLHLAHAAERLGWAMGVGSVRAAIENPQLGATFRVREVAPSIPLLANLGAVQLNYGYGAEECKRAVDMLEADGLVLHLNAMQEVFQPEGNTNFKNLLLRIEQLCRSLAIPVGVKEVGWGIDGATACRLLDAGVNFIDVAGAGGTSWSEVEKFRSRDALRRQAADAFADWGVPTAACVRDVRRQAPGAVIVASGGLTSGVDAAKALALGADLAGFGRGLLAAAVDGEDAVLQALAQVEFELRVAMFGIGARTLHDLRSTPALVTAATLTAPLA
ncbi:MAG: isopentenyl pyrophosphate isomerase [Paenibacillus sp.]|jgi:isopentenyl-diphosphate delta-isomerase|nr:isopentenyl pyrophosphate isomerase [Paenibacillus sp.]